MRILPFETFLIESFVVRGVAGQGEAAAQLEQRGASGKGEGRVVTGRRNGRRARVVFWLCLL